MIIKHTSKSISKQNTATVFDFIGLLGLMVNEDNLFSISKGITVKKKIKTFFKSPVM